jgi:carboxypeptidase C (cathepsin A)
MRHTCLASEWIRLIALVCAISLLVSHRASAQDADSDSRARDAANDDAKDSEKKSDKEPDPKITHHTVTIDGREIAYTATAGKMLMKTDEGDPKAHVFYVAYTVDESDGERDVKKDDDADDEEDDDEDEDNENESENENENSDVSRDAQAQRAGANSKRPITFCFNGGPGSSSVWLHLGMLGPQRVKLDSDARPLRPPGELLPNEYSLLDKTDLVFIDPVSTGFSRPAEGEDKRQFHGYDEDLRSVSQFIHDYTTKYNRWRSPKFVLGESYGGLRAAGLSGQLRRRYRMELNGIVIISGVVNFQTLAAGGTNDIAYVLFLPTYAATAWYHKALDDDMQEQSLEDVVAAARRFASGPYLRALAAGDALSEDRREQIIERMSELTGLSEDYVDAADLRVNMPRFGKELLRSRKRVVGRYDSRYTGIDRNTLGEYTEHDPSDAAVFGTFTAAVNDYLRSTLKVDEQRVYEILTGEVRPWNYDEFTNRYVDASESLREAMTQNPYLKVYAACGHYDLATPAYAMDYTRRHLGLPPEMRDNFTMGYYEGGHMMYVHEPSLIKLRKDLLKFYDSALSAGLPDDED